MEVMEDSLTVGLTRAVRQGIEVGSQRPFKLIFLPTALFMEESDATPGRRVAPTSTWSQILNKMSCAK